MNIIQIKPIDSQNGPGIRTSIWVAGCVNNCKGCWSPQTWNPNQGKPFHECIEEIDKALANKHIDGVSLLGGDPFYWVMENESPDFLMLLKHLKMSLNEKQTIWCWTGYTLNQLRQNIYADKCLEYIDVLVDSKFDESKKDLTLKFRGSSNQRIIDIQNDCLLYKYM